MSKYYHNQQGLCQKTITSSEAHCHTLLISGYLFVIWHALFDISCSADDLPEMKSKSSDPRKLQAVNHRCGIARQQLISIPEIWIHVFLKPLSLPNLKLMFQAISGSSPSWCLHLRRFSVETCISRILHLAIMWGNSIYSEFKWGLLTSLAYLQKRSLLKDFDKGWPFWLHHSMINLDVDCDAVVKWEEDRHSIGNNDAGMTVSLNASLHSYNGYTV